MQSQAPTIGFVGLGVMGGPMCRNVARKHPAPVHAFDLDEAAVREVAEAGVRVARSVAELAAASFEKLEPLLRYMGSDVTHCGEVGCGQVVKLINNTLVFEQVAALAEMMVVGERAGVAPEVLLRAVSKGSGDSFVLRNHGMKAMLPRRFPDKSFPPEYVLKDLGYTIELARSCGVQPKLPAVVEEYYRAAVEKGLGGRYFPAIIQLIERG